MKKEEFRPLVEEALPVIEGLRAIMDSYEVKGTVRIVMSKNGFMSMDLCSHGHEMVRLSEDDPVKIRYEEEL